MKRITLPMTGQELELRNARAREFRDVPEVLPIYTMAIDAVASRIDGDPKQKRQTEARLKATQKAITERESYVEAILLARVCVPPIWNEAELGPAPEGALSIDDFPESDLTYAQSAVVNLISGLDAMKARVEAERLTRFRDGTEPTGGEAAADDGGEAKRDEAEQPIGD